MSTLVMELDLIEEHVFHFQVADGQNVLIFGYIDNKKKDILVLRIGPAQGLEHTITAEKCTRLILL